MSKNRAGIAFPFHRSLVFRMAVILVPSYAIMFAFAFAAVRVSVTGSAYDALESKVTQVLVNVQYAASPLVKDERWSDLARLVENVGSSRFVKVIRIVAVPSMRVLASTNPLENGRVVEEPIVSRLLASGALMEVSPRWTASGPFEAAIPVAGSVFGTGLKGDMVAVAQYVADVSAELAVTEIIIGRLVFQSAAMFVAVLLLGLFLFSVYVTAPLKRFLETVEQVAAGDYGARIHAGGMNELSRFADAFDAMLEEVGRKDWELKDYSAVLERRVLERTESLTRKNGELVTLQERLVATERMAMAGKLAAGVAHGINNPAGFSVSNLGTLRKYIEVMSKTCDSIRELMELCAVSGDPAVRAAASALTGRLEKDGIPFMLDDARALVGETLEGIMRISGVVESLRSFASDPPRSAEAVDANEVAKSVVSAVRDVTSGGVSFSVSESRGSSVCIDEENAVRALSAVVINAAEACGSSGAVSLSVFPDGDFIVISVEDSGPGIPPDVMRRMFDPFFSTKAQGKGLGLSVAQAIVASAGGSVLAGVSRSGGARFDIRLPAAGKEPSCEDPHVGKGGE